jgi:hypothetical protein
MCGVWPVLLEKARMRQCRILACCATPALSSVERWD